jgi:hypothetical protein
MRARSDMATCRGEFVTMEPTGSQADAFGELRDPEMFHALADLDRNDEVVREDYARLS